MGLAFGYAGLATSEGVNVSLLFGMVSFIVGAIGGLVWIFSAEKAAKGAAPVEIPESSISPNRPAVLSMTLFELPMSLVALVRRRAAVGRDHPGDPAAVAALRAGAAECAVVASRCRRRRAPASR